MQRELFQETQIELIKSKEPGIDVTRRPPSHRTNLKALLRNDGWKGKWTGSEEMRYVNFLEKNGTLFEQQRTRKLCKVFIRMAKFIRTRTSNQCRSHHQKMTLYHSTIDNIVTHFKEVIFKKLELFR